jgi:methylmalonyl-CoA mutase N-terminal domain/subunit
VVGVNRYYENVQQDAPPVLKIDPKGEEEQVKRLTAYKASRDLGKVSIALTDLENAAHGEADLMPCIVACVRASCTLGEISDRLRAVFGEHHEI